MADKNPVVVSGRITADEDERLQALLSEHKTYKAHLVRALIMKWVEEQEDKYFSEDVI